jgi:two-component system, chemotaxis family, sensor kinase CheA
MQIDRQAVLQVFLAEANETLGQMEEALLLLEERPNDDELLGEVFRVVHMLKGNAAALDFKEVSSFAHSIEGPLASIRAREISIDKETINLLLQAVDALRAMVPAAAAGEDYFSPSQLQLMERFKEFSSACETARGRLADALHDAPPADEQTPTTPAGAFERASAPTLRINVEKLDRMLDLSGEIGIVQGRMRQLIENGGSRSSDQVLETLRDADRLTMELQEQVMDLRMVPIGPVFHRYARMVRDLAQKHGKLAKLVVEGEEAGVDTAVIANIRDPLTHMIRNAIDHGIEPPDVRRAAGKNPVGTISLRSFREAGTIVIQLADDGAGLNRGKIAQRARALDVSADPDKLSPQELHRLIFEPGFSTAEQISETSGRGVGMDIVRRNIEALHGRVEVESEEGRGVTVTIRLLLTLAIIEGFSVGVDSEVYVLPVDAILECVELPANHLAGNHGQGVMTLRGEPLPFIRLRHLFGLEGGKHRENVVIVGYQGGHAGIVVDTLYGEQQAVIKPLGNLFQDLPSISGSTILGNGRIALVLDVPGLYRAALMEEPLGTAALN